jgi:hypothetical protein
VELDVRVNTLPNLGQPRHSRVASYQLQSMMAPAGSCAYSLPSIWCEFGRYKVSAASLGMKTPCGQRPTFLHAMLRLHITYLRKVRPTISSYALRKATRTNNLYECLMYIQHDIGDWYLFFHFRGYECCKCCGIWQV